MRTPRALPPPAQFSLAPSLALVGLLLFASGCSLPKRPGAFAPRAGDEIMVAGRLVHTGTRVVLWTDPGGYDAYRVERRFSPFEESGWDKSRSAVSALTTPNRYGLRREGLTPDQVERVRGGGWDYPLLTQVVDQFVLHYDVCGTSRTCFKVLQDGRGLSVHFMLDLDGTIYQTLDLKERAWHATTSNTRSVGIEIANMGAYGVGARNPFDEWYAPDAKGGTRITLPERFGDGGILTPGFVGRPARPAPVTGVVQNQELLQYDFTPEQYKALTHLTATLCKVFPRIRCDYPRDATGKLLTQKLPEPELASYQGVIAHYHIQTNKTDPGPAFDWDRVILGARKLMKTSRPAAAKPDRR